MKKFEKYATLLLILWLLQKPIGYVAMMIYTRIYSPGQWSDLTILTVFSNYALMLFNSLVNILIGIWLFAIVKKEKEGAPWFWLMLAIFTSILAPILYFLIRIYKTVKPENVFTSENSKDVVS